MKLYRIASNLPSLLLVGLCLVLPPAEGFAQAAGTPHRIGFLSAYGASGAADLRAILVDALRERGYREGDNVVFVDRYADGKLARLPALAQELVEARVDVIATQSTPAAFAAKSAAPAVAVVNVSSGDAVGSGLVANLSRPGGNLTGLSFLGTELAVKQMELLLRLAPATRHIGFLANPGIQPERHFFQEMQRMAATAKIRMSFIDARTSRDYDAAFAEIARQKVDGLVVAPSIHNHDDWPRVVVLSGRKHLPTAYPFREFADAGGLVSYGFNRREFYGRAASHIEKILKGAKPGDIPLEQPSSFELVLNLKAADELRLTVPPSLLVQANSVIR